MTFAPAKPSAARPRIAVLEPLRRDLAGDVRPVEPARGERGVLHPRRERVRDRLSQQRDEARRASVRSGGHGRELSQSVAWSRPGGSPCGRRRSTAPRRACSTPCAGSASCRWTRSRRSRRRSSSSSGAGSARTTSPSSTGCSGRSGGCSSTTRSSTRSRSCRSSGRGWRAFAGATRRKRSQWIREFLRENARFRRHVLRELERNGPLLSRDLEHDLMPAGAGAPLVGRRQVGLMFEILAARGEVGVAGRVGKQRLWDLGERVFGDGRRPCRGARPSASSRSGASGRSACGSSAASGSRTRTPTTGPCPTARRCCRRSTG